MARRSWRITGLTFHDLRGVRYQQSVDTVKLMEPLTVYNEEVTGPQHAILIANRAAARRWANRGVAHLTISKDVQLMKLSADKRSMRKPRRPFRRRHGARPCQRRRRISCGRPHLSSMRARALQCSRGRVRFPPATRSPSLPTSWVRP